MKSNEFYTDYQHLFHESPDYFCHFLKSDCSLFTEVLSERTNVKLESIQVENGLQFMKNFISHHLSTINELEFQEVLELCFEKFISSLPIEMFTSDTI